MNYNRVELEEGAQVQFVGVYVLHWDREWGQPEVGFVENSYTIDDALSDLQGVQLIDNTPKEAKLALSEIVAILNKLADTGE